MYHPIRPFQQLKIGINVLNLSIYTGLEEEALLDNLRGAGPGSLRSGLWTKLWTLP